MKFLYQYRTPDNRSHTGVVRAASRDAAYAALKAQGVRPGRVEEAPGFFNKLFGKGKRWMAIAVLGLLALVAFAAVRSSNERIRVIEESHSAPMMRRQIYGDPALMESLEHENFASVFPNVGDRYLARFAQPAVMPRFADHGWRQSMAEALRNGKGEIAFAETDAREVVELKRIVLWMRTELANYLSDGKGSVQSYIRRLEERQERELRVYCDVKAELERSDDQALWTTRNATLRDLGIRTIPMPDAADRAQEKKIKKN